MKINPILLALLIVVFFSWLQISNSSTIKSIRDRLEYLAYDIRLNLFTDKTNNKDDRIVIVNIDEKSLRQEGRWPWPRDKIAKLVKNISDAGATVIAFDVIFSEKERNSALDVLAKLDYSNNNKIKNFINKNISQFDNDNYFSKSMKGKDIVLGYITHTEENIMPIGSLPTPTIVTNKSSIMNSTLYLCIAIREI